MGTAGPSLGVAGVLTAVSVLEPEAVDPAIGVAAGIAGSLGGGDDGVGTGGMALGISGVA